MEDRPVEKDDLISRAAAIEYLMTNMGWHDDDGYAVDDADEKRAIITDLVNGIPAVDAVPVVRCKDCKFRDVTGPYPVCRLDSADPWEQTRNADVDDWFCAEGERRERE